MLPILHKLVMGNVTERLQMERRETDFISAVVHELKTPLTSIMGFLELLQEKELTRERQRYFLSICQDESKRLLYLIDNILTSAKLDNAFQICKNRHDLCALLKKCVGAFEEIYTGYEFALLLAENECFLEYDEVLLRQVVDNLLTNAVKFTPGGGRIQICESVKEQCVIVSVADNGVGIDAQQLPFIFDKFYRADNSLTCSVSGVGLGLSNSRRIIEEHGGTIWAESKENEGAVFFFSLPLPSAGEKYI